LSFKEIITGLDPNVSSAIIGSLTALFTLFLKDILIANLNKRKVKNEEIERMYKKYSVPIAQAVESLSWRTVEILEKRSQFLLIDNHNSDFYKYKYISTLYRLARVLGWLQALENEYTYIETGNANKNEKIRTVIKKFRNTLSDGTHIENKILYEIMELFQISNSHKSKKLAVEVEDIIIKYSDNGKKCSIKKLDSKAKKKLVYEVVSYINNSLDLKNTDESIIEENKEKAIRIMARRETWIYRDWQDDIGNKMLTKSLNKSRKYEVISFGEFEEIYNSKERPIWLKRLSDLFEDINLEKKDYYDARIIQINDILTTSVDIYKVFWELNKIDSSVEEESIQKLEVISKKHNKALKLS